MSAPAPEFTAPRWGDVQADDAPPFTAPKQEKRAPIFGGAKKGAEGNKPSRTPRARTSSPKAKVPSSREGQFTDTLMQMYGMVAMGISVKDPQCGKAILEAGHDCAVAWDKLAVENDAVRKVLFAMTNVTGVGAVIAAHIPIAMAIAAHHGPGIGPKVVADNNEEAVTS